MPGKLSKKVEWVKPDEIVPYARNAKQHPQEQIDKLKASIKEYGFTRPILVDEENVILYGHGAREAAMQLGLEKIPILRMSGLTKAQKKAYRLADNRLAETPWDVELLSLEFEELSEFDMDLTLTGFNEDEIMVLLGNTIAEEEIDEKEITEESTKPKNKCPRCGYEW